jgi:hypothetical protein
MIIVIVVLVFVSEMFSKWLKHRKKNAPAEDGRIAQLEDRVRVLEQIVTDSGYELRRQFRDLERGA